MRYKLKPVSDQTIVITGASSGIGLATARLAAARGANVVLVSRNEDALQKACSDINDEYGEEGGRSKAVYAVADVADRSALEKVVEKAREEFEGFDTWVNDAGLSIYGALEEVKEEDNRRLFDTNFWGVVNGSLVALKHLKGRGGALINIGSEVSDVAIPLQGMYSASKHAVKGFTNALRVELEAQKAPVSVTLIKPGAINTPFPHHAKNYLEKEPKLPPPVYPPEEVAKAILYAASHRIRDLYVGGAAKLMGTMAMQTPRLVDRMNRGMIPAQLSDEPPRNPEGALYQPGDDGEAEGDYPGRVMSSSLYTRAKIHPVLTGAAITAAGVVGAAALAAWLMPEAPARVMKWARR